MSFSVHWHDQKCPWLQKAHISPLYGGALCSAEVQKEQVSDGAHTAQSDGSEVAQSLAEGLEMT